MKFTSRSFSRLNSKITLFLLQSLIKVLSRLPGVSQFINAYLRLAKDGNLVSVASNLGFRGEGIIHVGAHLGEERQLYKELGISHRIWIEAVPEFYEKLKYLVEPDVSILSAIWSESATLPIHISNNLVSSSFFDFASSNPMNNQEMIKKILVQTSTLDQIVIGHLPSSAHDYFLVLDIQGSELEALKGLSLENSKVFTAIITEVSEREIYQDGAKAKEVRKHLRSYGYKLLASYVRPPYYHGDEIWIRETIIKANRKTFYILRLVNWIQRSETCQRILRG